MTAVLLLLAAGTAAGQEGADRGRADRDAAGLTVGKIRLETQDIFSRSEVAEADALLGILRRTMNGLHTNTRHHVLRQELLFREGDPFDPEDLAETERNLRELGFLNRIRVVPTDTTSEGRVDILVSVRDSWSLQTNLTYTRSSGGDTRWSLQASEKNFLGYGVTLGAGLGADENGSYWNLWFRKRRISRLGLLVGVDYFQRSDGHYRNLFVHRPFYAQNDSWGFRASAFDGLGDTRWFLSHAGPAGIDPAQEESLYAKLPAHSKGASFVFQKRVSTPDAGRVWRLGLGVRVTWLEMDPAARDRWELSDGRYVNLDFLAGPGQPLTRDQGTTVFPHLQVQTEPRNWAKARFVLQYGPVEDIPLGPVLDLATGPAGPRVGSTSGFGGSRWLSELRTSWWLPVAWGFGNLSAWGTWQAGGADERYRQYGLIAGWIGRRGPEKHPWITRVFAEYAGGENLAGNQALLLGLERGLRTLEFDGMAGDRLVRWNVEQGKATEVELLGLFRVGGAVFYSGGCAWWRDESRSLADARQEVGCGLRLGPTRSAGTQVSRLDVSWALDGSAGPVFTATTRGFF
jgi:hypothetical protein